MEYEGIIKKMTLEDKITLCSGKDFWHTKDFPEYGIPSIMLSDGPNGIRKQNDTADMLGIHDSVKATCFPTAVTAGMTWNRELIQKAGKAIGEEAESENVAVVLGPGVNLKRSPLCGRNFEYYSEDPFVSGELGAAFVVGVQQTNTAACIKHFAANNQEYSRFSSDSQVDERTLRELYLSAFERVVKKAHPQVVMSAYPMLNGIYCSDNKKLLIGILREEWGFDGMVVTDWGGMNDHCAGIQAGCDLSMPGGAHYQDREVREAVIMGKVQKKELDACVSRILSVVFKTGAALQKSPYSQEDHAMLAQHIAEEGSVLLKNTGSILPLKKNTKLVLIGHMAQEIRYQGAGSSHINASSLIHITDAMPFAAYSEGCSADGSVTEESLYQACLAAKNADVAVVCAGLTDSSESEGFDRDNMDMPDGQNRMIEAVAQTNPNTVVVLMGGSPMCMPWFDKVKAVLYLGLCGQSGGNAVRTLLTGEVSPSGKLTETWPLRASDVPCSGFYAEGRKNAQYREGLYVGYRYYEKAGVPVRFPFGFGLSYTSFAYSGLYVEKQAEKYAYKVTVTVKNTGTTGAAEVVQLYVGNPQNGIYRAKKELKGFEKIFLKPEESREVNFFLNERSFAVYDTGWNVPPGTYVIQAGASSLDIRLSESIEIKGVQCVIPAWQKNSWYENPCGNPSKSEWEKLMGKRMEDDPVLKPGNFTMNNTIRELAPYSLVAKIIVKGIEKEIAKKLGIKPDKTNSDFRMEVSSSVDCSLRGISISSCGRFPSGTGKAVIELANGHKIQGLKMLMSKPKKEGTRNV